MFAVPVRKYFVFTKYKNTFFTSFPSPCFNVSCIIASARVSLSETQLLIAIARLLWNVRTYSGYSATGGAAPG